MGRRKDERLRPPPLYPRKASTVHRETLRRRLFSATSASLAARPARGRSRGAFWRPQRRPDPNRQPAPRRPVRRSTIAAHRSTAGARNRPRWRGSARCHRATPESPDLCLTSGHDTRSPSPCLSPSAPDVTLHIAQPLRGAVDVVQRRSPGIAQAACLPMGDDRQMDLRFAADGIPTPGAGPPPAPPPSDGFDGCWRRQRPHGPPAEW